MNTKYTYIYLKLLTEFSLQVEIEAYKIQDIYDMNFNKISTTSQPQDEHKQIRVAQTNIVHHTLQTKVQIQTQVSNRVHARYK